MQAQSEAPALVFKHLTDLLSTPSDFDVNSSQLDSVLDSALPPAALDSDLLNAVFVPSMPKHLKGPGLDNDMRASYEHVLLERTHQAVEPTHHTPSCTTEKLSFYNVLSFLESLCDLGVGLSKTHNVERTECLKWLHAVSHALKGLGNSQLIFFRQLNERGLNNHIGNLIFILTALAMATKGFTQFIINCHKLTSSTDQGRHLELSASALRALMEGLRGITSLAFSSIGERFFDECSGKVIKTPNIGESETQNRPKDQTLNPRSLGWLGKTSTYIRVLESFAEGSKGFARCGYLYRNNNLRFNKLDTVRSVTTTLKGFGTAHIFAIEGKIINDTALETKEFTQLATALAISLRGLSHCLLLIPGFMDNGVETNLQEVSIVGLKGLLEGLKGVAKVRNV